VVLLVLIAAVVGFRVAAALQHRDGGEVLVKSSSSSMSSSPSASTVASASSAGPEENDGDEPAQVQVHVVGAVKHPGLYRLKPGTRVDDAVKAAGGALGRADLGAINLAAPVADGTQVRVPVHGETAAPAVGPATSSDPAGSPQPDAGAPVNLNTADATTLQTLPGIGPALSQRLIEWREQHGSFGSGTDLDAVPGIGPAMLAKLEGKVSYG
jgi:competence protein ComEA